MGAAENIHKVWKGTDAKELNMICMHKEYSKLFCLSACQSICEVHTNSFICKTKVRYHNILTSFWCFKVFTIWINFVDRSVHFYSEF